MIEVQAAHKAFGENVIFDDVSVQLHLGSYYTLTGPNGSGKSTLMKCLLQQENLTEGQMLLDGVAVKSSSKPFRTRVFGINDAIGWLPGLTVGQHLEMMARSGKKIAADLGTDADDLYSPLEALEELGVPQAYDREPYMLSSGQQQRSRLASLLVRPARYYFLDEPEKRLDTSGVEWIAEWVDWRVNDLGDMVCIATHDPYLNELAGTVNLRFPLNQPAPLERGE
ncbi:MAG: ATP-binding cassette domain-containing protein [Rothia sp. (in: high G+C Gram-positive bacteria)]|nr:ATP-binding cassette domain-containing protein [Rothia sp. (in: high G+C Gram-positive bacteria)]